MWNVISEFESSADTAFAHCISDDIHNGRSMSAGVAVAFRMGNLHVLTSSIHT
jgi:hypothetical protein